MWHSIEERFGVHFPSYRPIVCIRLFLFKFLLRLILFPRPIELIGTFRGSSFLFSYNHCSDQSEDGNISEGELPEDTVVQETEVLAEDQPNEG